MSIETQELTGVRVLPIFPLELALMPNEFQALHIFEPRYRAMIADVRKTDSIFGINYFRAGSEFETWPAIGSVGCAAQIGEFELLPDGRSNLMTVGLTRYRILGYVDQGTPYLTAEVEFFGDQPVDETIVQPIADDVFSLFKRVAAAAHVIKGQPGELPPISPAPPEALSFLVAAAFSFDTPLKYRLITGRSTVERLEIVRRTLRDAVGKLEEDAAIHKASRTNGHSKKKIGH